ncbi:Zn(II)2Cys6 transcription factor [Sporobolomyces koalae]|uniref:Zn(II)2Cys6 transcription factor n=1 Tax=Sporobolomyces koalae TaxID=500713 RepID=UPI00316FFD1B
MAHNSVQPISTSNLVYKRSSESSNGDYGGGTGPSPPDQSARQYKKARKTSPSPAGEVDTQPKKRTKQILSCSECKRRKIKCDRCQPCSACVKRGAPHECCWEDAKIEPERQPFALIEDVDEMRERLSLLEKFINKLPATLTSTGFAELGITKLGPLLRERQDDLASLDRHQMFENLDRLDNGECPELYSLPGEGCMGPTSTEHSHDNLELLENALMIVTRTPDRQKAELTDALTSILAPHPVFVDSTSATRLGLDLVFSQAEFLEERKRTLDKIFRILPNKEDSHRALERYRHGFHWMFTCLHFPSLQAEHKKFWEMTEAGRRDEVDPAWLAIYTLVLALSWNDTTFMEPWLTAQQPKDTPEVVARKEQEATAFYAASQRLFLLADPYGRPQVRIMQCVMLSACWTVIAAADSSDWGRFSTLLAIAIRVGHALQLHRLTDDPENMPPDDPAWPAGKNSVKRENALRIWSSFTFYDHLAAISRFSTYMINAEHTTTPILSNIESKDLSPTEWKIEPQPTSIATDATLERLKFRLAEISRKTFDLYVTGKKSFNYSAILELDREYRAILDSMPDTWVHEHKASEEKDPFLRSRRYGALQSVHNRIVRLHRPFLSRGYAPNSKFAFSTEACVKSAKTILFCHHNNIGFMIKPLYSHSLSASIVLAADLFHHIDNGTSAIEIESKKENLALSLEIFSEEAERRLRSQHLRAIVGQARRILSGLFLEVEKRRARRMARMAHGKGNDAGKVESFAEILSRIAREDPNAPIAMNQTLPSEASSTSQPYNPSKPPPRVPTPAAQYAFPTPTSQLSSSTELPAEWSQPSFYTGFAAPVEPANNDLLTNTLFTDLGILDANGQMIDYYGDAGAHSLSSGTGPSPSDSLDLSFLGLGTGDQDGAANGNDASQRLFQQLTSGW